MPALSPSPSENAQVSPHHMEGPSAKQNNIYKCHICEKVFGIAYSWSVYGWGAYVLNNHAKQTGHLAWACSASGCDQSFLTHRERDAHQRRPHLNGHGRINPDSPNDCAECGMSSRSNAALIRHAEEHLHQPYGCQCGVFFSRRDVLHRHLDSLSRSKPEYPCTYCKRHRGADGFRRKDHLLQHMRNYHHLETEPDSFRVTFPVCSHADCAFYRNEAFAKSENAEDNKPFASQSAYTRHMREEHNESPFPCTISGCNRIGKKGYFREKDLRLHHLKEHPNAPAYRATKG
ncbi:uncharacterized protein LY89DRAFT_651228 [Mollisia scopiformis]|uniref:C2H2-type domain-containing protein n=1 Tax=Mollisia scopiformis TaxID=149040 RepID=A0A194WYV5_MOLSC|nr:uncharacterized protein LY89DRAFT_651228 [Mollisia scopiformis]KUJ13146.1 hypothetical protein LY89DRAFT_651228 [Mollisia scopiformis]